MTLLTHKGLESGAYKSKEKIETDRRNNMKKLLAGFPVRDNRKKAEAE